MIRFVIVDDSPDFRIGFRMFVESNPLWYVIREFSSGDEILAEKRMNYVCDIICMDYQMPGTNGLETARRLLQKYPDLKVLCLTNHIDKLFLEELVLIGFKGCTLKRKATDNLSKAVKTIIENKIYFEDEDFRISHD